MNGFDVFMRIAAFVFGGVVGSFLNVCIYRLPKGESIVFPGSRCPKCGASIAWYDNIPIFGWVMLRGKCRHCGASISWQYPVVEGLTAVLFLLIGLRFGYALATPVYMVLAAGLVVVTFVDIAHWIIPNEVTYPGIFIGLACAAVTTWYPGSGLRVIGPMIPVFNAFIGLAAGGGILYALDKLALLLLKKRGMGFGDVKLLAMLGAFFGWPGVILTIMIASVLGSAVGLTLIWALGGKDEAKGKEEAKEDGRENAEEEEDDLELTISAHYLPFGPYLCIAGLVVMFFGQEIYAAYVAWFSVAP